LIKHAVKSEPINRFMMPLAFIDGGWTESTDGARIDVKNPANGQIVGQVASVTSAQVTEAIDAAERALPSWSRVSAAEKSVLLQRWCDLLLANRQELAEVMTLEQGKPLFESVGEIEYSANYFRWYAEEVKRMAGETIHSHLPNRRMTLDREPVGVVAAITPWNFPSAMLARKAAAALAAGCTVVSLPSSATPFSALALAKLAEDAGFPRGVFSVVTGKSREIVPVLCADQRVRAVTFTGSTEVGRVIATLCAPTVKRMCLELGGHAPFIVFDDADLDAAVAGAMNAKFQTSGQDCLAANRIYVQAGIHDAFVKAFSKATAGLKTGNGLDAKVMIGPLINKDAVQKVAQQVEDAVKKGAKIETGGAGHDAGENFYQPTVLSKVTDDMLIMREETFGPLAGISVFQTEDEVIRRANNTEYGLVSYVYSQNLSRTERVARQLEFGMVGINTSKLTGAPIPFGGIKQSGMGREGHRMGLEEFTNLKYTCAAY
jgi:aspartate-semialdehyde dehydrogenase